MATLTATRGLPGSGKTTFAMRQLAAAEPGALVRMNRDDLRVSMHGQGYFIHDTEKQINTVQHGGIERLLRSGVSVIVDDTNLRARNLRGLAEIAWRVGADFEVKDFTDVSLETCIGRNAYRDVEDRVPPAVIRNMHAKFLAGKSLPLPIPDRPVATTGAPYVPDLSLPPAVMVDIDGTVALHGDRDPYDPSRYHEDLPNSGVIAAITAMWISGYRVVFCSGRDETYRDATEQWLKEKVAIPAAALHMREKGDTRRDDVIKLELFDKHIRNAWNVVCVFDDRDRVVQAWRSIGLTVFQVAEGAF